MTRHKNKLTSLRGNKFKKRDNSDDDYTSEDDNNNNQNEVIKKVPKTDTEIWNEKIIDNF